MEIMPASQMHATTIRFKKCILKFHHSLYPFIFICLTRSYIAVCLGNRNEHIISTGFEFWLIMPNGIRFDSIRNQLFCYFCHKPISAIIRFKQYNITEVCGFVQFVHYKQSVCTLFPFAVVVANAKMGGEGVGWNFVFISATQFACTRSARTLSIVQWFFFKCAYLSSFDMRTTHPHI